MEPGDTQAPTAPQPAQPAPVMDVVPPRPSAQVAVNPETGELHVAPPQEKDPDAPKAAQPDKEHEPVPHEDSHQKAAQPVVHKKSDSSVKTAIVASIVIVLGMAALATYAFIQTQK